MSAPLSEKDLLKQMARGNEKAFEALFRAWYGLLVIYAHRFLRDKMEAESVVQTVFINLWERRKTLKIKHIKNYLKVAVRNRCVNQLNRRKQHQSLDERWDLAAAEPDDELPNEALLEKINRAIDRMPPQRQKIFKMGRFEGLRYKDIATLLSISPKTVETQMSKALKYLRDLFADSSHKKQTST